MTKSIIPGKTLEEAWADVANDPREPQETRDVAAALARGELREED